MAKNTDVSLQNKVIYSVYVRNHTEEGTFNAVIEDLDRIKALGTDIIWFMPIHPIGEKGKKGTLGCPYANRDYRSVNPEYGSLDDFKRLVSAIHDKGMLCMIDVVYNHTSPDSILSAEHPEFFYHDENGNFGNKIGDWSDVIDLDYNNKELWDYQIESLKYWAGIVDGFRCDVASFVPLEFWKKAREEVEKVNPDHIWLAESVHRGFGTYARSLGFNSVRDTDLFEAFDIEYEYDIREKFENYLEGKTTLDNYADLLNFQEAAYPANYNKLRFLENHDTRRIFELASEEAMLINLTAMLYLLKGTTLIYAGQEFVNSHTPSLFEKDVIRRDTNKDLSGLMQRLSYLKHNVLAPDDITIYSGDNDNDILTVTRSSFDNNGKKIIKTGIFSLMGKSGEVSVNLPDGPYENLIDGSGVIVMGGKCFCKGWPMLITGEI